MAHELDMTNNRANMAYVGEMPWHGLGFELQQDAPIDEWRVAAGFDWQVKSAPISFAPEGFEEVQIAKRKALYRSDTGANLSVVSDMYKVVQPAEVMDFFAEVCRAGGFRMETAGMLKGGAVYWALARTGCELNLGGHDIVLPYMLLATSCDKTLSTTAMLTSTRVVCNNTLSYAVEGTSTNALRIPHSTGFDPKRVMTEFGLIDGSWDAFGAKAKDMTRRTVSQEEAVAFYLKLMCPNETDIDLSKARPALTALLHTYEHGVGQDEASARGTVWGLVNAVTRYVDHDKKSASRDNRLTSAWFGSGARLKQNAWDAAEILLAA